MSLEGLYRYLYDMQFRDDRPEESGNEEPRG